MRLITVAGPPSCGKTAVLARTASLLQTEDISCAVVKFDCLQTKDHEFYQEKGIPATSVLAGGLCPDHFFAVNLEETIDWAARQQVDCCIIETAGLCNRCSPHLRGVLSLCILDNLMGIDAPAKIGPMLKLADLILITKGDLVSQAEREVYRHRIRQMNRKAIIRHINGLTGQGCRELAAVLRMAPDVQPAEFLRLRFAMPAAVCSYCLSETRIGSRYQKGNVKKAEFGKPFSSIQSGIKGIEKDTRHPGEPQNNDTPQKSGIKVSDVPNDQQDTKEGIESNREEGQEQEKDRDHHSTDPDIPEGQQITVTAGQSKSGTSESREIHFQPGHITALVGPTGSGKSRFLHDIESLANKDTPSRRRILLNGRIPDPDERFDLQGRLVAQLTQNMNFVLDVPAGSFIRMHAESRGISHPEQMTRRVLAAANELAGERFAPETQLTQLSGGQSRALMIADTALLSASPVLLIDEIENAGVDKTRALALLLAAEKIVVMATHDPVTALSADRRLVFSDGAVRAIQNRTPEEEELCRHLKEMESRFSDIRSRLRTGAVSADI